MKKQAFYLKTWQSHSMLYLLVAERSFCANSLEDLAVMKLYAYRPNDIADLNSPEFLATLNWNQLDYLIRDPKEALASSPSERSYSEMVCAYERYRKEHCR